MWAPQKSANDVGGGLGCEAKQPELFVTVLPNDLNSYKSKSVTVLVAMGIPGLRLM